MESPAIDVLPTGVRRRLRLRDGMLPAVLLGELLAGVVLGAAWPRLTTPPGAHAQVMPTTAVRIPVTVPAVVAPARVVAPPPAAVPVPAHTPATVPTARNPFAALTR